MPLDTYRLLAKTINFRYPSAIIHCHADHVLSSNSMPLDCAATFFEYVVIDGNRFYASRTVGRNKSSFVHAIIPGLPPVDAYGEVLEIFWFDQDIRPIGCPLWFAHLRWFKPWLGEREKLWDELYVLYMILVSIPFI
jgi:hypothetical protein